MHSNNCLQIVAVAIATNISDPDACAHIYQAMLGMKM